jgi:TonB family protein
MPENFAPLRMSASLASSTRQYRVHSDLNLESLPQSNRDPNRKVWWMNSLAASVLGIGVFLTKEPAEFVFKPVALEAPMRIEVVQPHVEVLQQVDRQEVPDEPVEEVEVAVIQPIVVAADPSKVAFAIEVKGPTVTSADLRKLAPPPAITQRPKAPDGGFGPRVLKFGEQGIPKMEYPPEALRANIQGKFKLKFPVGLDGTLGEFEVLESSGANLLEREAKKHVKRFANFGPSDKPREFLVEFEFRLN